MPAIDLKLEGDGAWPELANVSKRGKLIELDGEERTLGVALFPRGTVNGNPTVALRIDLPSGHTLIYQTTFALLRMAVDAIEIRLESIASGN